MGKKTSTSAATRSPDTKSKQLLVRLEPDEKEAFADAAELAGIPLSAWVRERLRKAARQELEEARLPIAFLSHVAKELRDA